MPEAKSEATEPPNLRESPKGSRKSCSNCKMFDDGICWGYGNWPVAATELCDSWSPDTKPDTKSAATAEVYMSATAAPPVTAPDSVEWRQTRAEQLSDSQRKHSDARPAAAPLELRAERDGVRTLRSYASLFNTPYAIGSSGYRYQESVRPGAFKRSLGTGPDVVFRYDHTGPPLARTKNHLGLAPSLRLGEDERGLWYEADLDTTDPDVQALIPKVQRGDLSESSFAFRCVKDVWNDDFTTRSLEECELDRGDVSVVTFGASRATGGHMLLRSEQFQELGLSYEDLLAALTELSELRTGKVLSTASMNSLAKILALLGQADVQLDKAQAVLAELTGLSNPNDKGKTNGKPKDQSDGDVSVAEQLQKVGRSFRSAAGDGDRARTAPHLFDSILVDLGHLHRHVERLAEPDVVKDPESLAFNQDHAMRHVLSAQDHAMRLGDHLEEHPSDPMVFRGERAKLGSMRALFGLQEVRDRVADLETLMGPSDEQRARWADLQRILNEAISQADGTNSPEVNGMDTDERNAPTYEDYDVMSGLKNVKLALAAVKACQLADPDHDSDPDDKAVMACIEGAEAQVDQAITAQGKDARRDPEEESKSADESAEDQAEETEEVSVPQEDFWSVVKDLAGRGDWDIYQDGALVFRYAGDEEGEDEYWLRDEDDVEQEHRADLSEGSRKKMASSGTAMADGSYPIPNVAYLKKAIRAFGRAKDKSAVKTWIKRRAKALGATNLIPEGWRAEIPALVANDTDDLSFDLMRSAL